MAIETNHSVRGVPSSEGTPRRFSPPNLARKLVYGLGAVTGVVLLWRFLNASDDTAPPKPGIQAVTVDHVRSLIVRKDGQPLWEIAADQIRVAADTSTTEVRNMTHGVVYRDGKPAVTVSAPIVQLKNGSNDLHASGGIQATSNDGLQIRTPAANWNQNAGEITCPQPVNAELKGLKMTLPRIRYVWNKHQLTAPGPVNVTGKGFTLRGARLRAQTDRRIVHLDGGAILTFDPNLLDRKGTIPPPTASH
jgi:LPS export ABC transporter protein LptC